MTIRKRLILPHDYYDKQHLAEVKAEMRERGAPTLRAIVRGRNIFLLEGTHRARAAKALKLPIHLIEIEAPEDDTIAVWGLPGCKDCDFDNQVCDVYGIARIKAAIDDPDLREIEKGRVLGGVTWRGA